MDAAGWGRDCLSSFMEISATRLFQTYAGLGESWARLAEVDKVFCRISEHLDESEHWLEATLLIRSHSAYRAGVRLAGSGQVPESYMVLRGCLEFALYGLFMAGNSTRELQWLQRSKSADSRKRFRADFTAGAILRHAASKSDPLGQIAKSLYEHLIDFGAHPNDLGLGVTATFSETEDKNRIDTTQIAGDGPLVPAALKTAVKVGICALRLFEQIFTERFRLLSLDVELDAVSRGL